MGIFTNPCINPECEHRVRKGSKFCPKCGAAAPKGLTSCGRCGKEVRTSSKFCWSCGADLAKELPPAFGHNRWARGPEDFAIRVEVDDIRRLPGQSLAIDHGTRALLFQGGKFKGELGEGQYDLSSIITRVANFLADKPVSVLLMDAGDMAIDLENGSLWTADSFEVGTSSRLLLQVADPDLMFVNLIKGQRCVAIDGLEEGLAGEVQMVLSGILARYRADQLFSSLDARYEIEAQLREHLTGTLARLGLNLVQLRFIDFSGEAFEALRRRRGEVQAAGASADITAQRAAIAQRLRETLTRDRMHAFKDQKDFEDFVRQTEHELSLKGVIRDDEMQRLKQRFSFERNREDLLRRIEIEGIAKDEVREQAWKQLLADEREHDERHRRVLDRQLASTQGEAEVRNTRRGVERLDHEEKVRQQEADHIAEMKAARDGVSLLKEMKEIEQAEADREQARKHKDLEAFSKASVEALLGILDGPAADRLVKLERFRAQQKMTPEQLLMVSAAGSPAVAEALGRKYAAEGQVSAELMRRLERQLVDQQQMSEAHAARLERVMQTALQQMGGVAVTRAQAFEPQQTVVVPGAIGAPVVVNPQSGHGVGVCRHCGAAVDSGARFCSQCGKEQ